MKLIYVGPHDGVRVLLPGGGEVAVGHGQSADFPAQLATGLLEQPANWKRGNGKKPAAEEG